MLLLITHVLNDFTKVRNVYECFLGNTLPNFQLTIISKVFNLLILGYEGHSHNDINNCDALPNV